MLPRSTLIPLLPLILLTACGGSDEEDRWTRLPEELPAFSKGEGSPFRVLFYNCENLYDPKDASGIKDDAFTPEGSYEWSVERYSKKLERIAEVIGVFADRPDLVGLCEVENDRVLKDLCERGALKEKGYGILHYQSRDPRGSDLALLFDPSSFQPYDRKAHRITVPGSGTPSRPILSVGLESSAGDSLRLFLCHWPSRAGGKERSAPHRRYASRVLQEALQELHREHPTRKVLVMGDLNDHPPNESVRSLIEAEGGWNLKDLFAKAHAKGHGTYNYQGKWGVLDHFIINKKLRKARSGLRYQKGSAKILRREELLYYDKKGQHYQPDRFMERGSYYGGYSDHLPIVMELEPAAGL